MQAAVVKSPDQGRGARARAGEEIEVMRRWSRTIAYAASLFTLLGLGSFWLYHSPSQVELRLRSTIGRWATVPVELGACRSDPFGAGLQVEAVRVPAAPPLTSRTLLVLEDLRFEGSRGTAFRRGLRRERSPPDLELTRLRVGKARLVLEYERHRPLDARVGRWNFESLFRPGTSLADLGHAPAQILADRMTVLLRLLEAGSRPQEWEIGFEAVDVRPTAPRDPPTSDGARSDTGLLLEGDLTEGEFWAGGQLDIAVLPDGVVELEGHIDDLRLLPRHRELVPEAWRSLCADLDPVGTVDLTIESLRLSSREEARVSVLARHYDSGLRIGPQGPRLDHIRGVVSINETGVRFGQFAEIEPLEAELWGVVVRLGGLLSSAQQRLRIEVPETQLQDLGLAAGRRSAGENAAPAHLAALMDALGPAGSIHGEITGELAAGRGDAWKGSLAFADFTLQGWPWIHGGAGRIGIRAIGETRGDVIRVDRLELARVGVLAGEIMYSWSEEGVRLSSPGLQPAGEKAAEANGGAAATTGPVPADGTIFGRLAWSWENGLTELDVRWMDLALETELFTARGFGGHLRTANAEVGGVIECGATDIPAALFGADGETWTFERGRGRILLGDGNIRIPGMKLLGKDWSLRFRGKVHVSGDLDFVAVLAPAEIYGFRVDELDTKDPEAWKETAGSDVRMYRVTGTMAEPRVRAMGPLDPAVIR